nr:MAG TPA: Cytosine specific methyltransferase [Caudoviricetes sp.]
MSVEKDPDACETLRLRAFLSRIADKEPGLPWEYEQFLRDRDPRALDCLKKRFPIAWAGARCEVIEAELGDADSVLIEVARMRVKGVSPSGVWVLAGGPPCQAYSTAGRSRRKHDPSFADDPRLRLYKSFMKFVHMLCPPVVVFENVVGILSAKVDGEPVFSRIVRDFRSAGYSVRSVVDPCPATARDYIVESERFGIPQARHRVILLAVRRGRGLHPGVLRSREVSSVRDAFVGLPKLHGVVSYPHGTCLPRFEEWKKLAPEPIAKIVRDAMLAPNAILSEANEIRRGQGRLSGWYRGKLDDSKALEGHAARTVRTVDMERYVFCAAFAQVKGRSPRLEEMPRCLWPNHANLDDIDGDSRPAFNDRFYVQAWGKPSSTVTAHIAKSGHHFIHPDPRQHRSLTLREAARLQTFPDDFVFMGTKTAQFRQVGNAVPPLLAQQVAQIVAKTLGVDSYGYFDSLEGEDSEEEADAPKLRGVDMFLDAIFEFTDGINGMFVKVAEGLDKITAPR